MAVSHELRELSGRMSAIAFDKGGPLYENDYVLLVADLLFATASLVTGLDPEMNRAGIRAERWDKPTTLERLVMAVEALTPEWSADKRWYLSAAERVSRLFDEKRKWRMSAAGADGGKP